MNKAIFSPTIIASSTTIPNTKINVNRESILIERFNGANSQNPPMKEIGIPKETQNANFGFKNKANTIMTSMRPC